MNIKKMKIETKAGGIKEHDSDKEDGIDQKLFDQMFAVAITKQV